MFLSFFYYYYLEEAMKALENALSQKKDVFENWNNKIEERGQERQGGGGTG